MPKELSDTFVASPAKAPPRAKKPEPEQEPAKPEEKPNEAFSKFMTDLVPKLPREYVHKIAGVKLQDEQILLVPFDSLNTTRVSLVLDSKAIDELENIVSNYRKAR